MPAFRITTPRGPRTIGSGYTPFVIAEMSGNHNQSFDRARRLIDAAVEADVDAIKLQTYTADTMTIDCDAEHFRVRGTSSTWEGLSLYRLYQLAHTPWDWQARLKEHAEAQGVLLFSSAFDETSVSFLESLGVELYKVASFELRDHELLRCVGATRKPVIISRGMASVEDIDEALRVLLTAGAPAVALLHCVSAYPAKVSGMNLRTIPDLAARFDVVPGLSDHTLGTAVAVASVALGACVIEKHYTLSRADGGPDAEFSLEPHELRQLVTNVRDAYSALGEPTYETTSDEQANLVFRRSIFVVEDVPRATVLTETNTRVIRPGYGLAPKHYRNILGRRTSCDIARGTPLSFEMLAQSNDDS